MGRTKSRVGNMRFILVMFCILCVTMVTKSTMNVGTIWFKQNNGNFLRKLPILRQKISRINENPSIYPVMKPEEKNFVNEASDKKDIKNFVEELRREITDYLGDSILQQNPREKSILM